MIDDGALENPHVDRTFALHLYSGLEAGKIGIRDGPFFSSSDRFDIELIGQGRPRRDAREGGRSDRGAAEFIALLQTIASREVAPADPVVVTVGSLHAGTTFNVIPERAELQGTVRAFDERCPQGDARTHRTSARRTLQAMRLEIYVSNTAGSTRRR